MANSLLYRRAMHRKMRNCTVRFKVLTLRSSGNDCFYCVHFDFTSLQQTIITGDKTRRNRVGISVEEQANSDKRQEL